MTRPRSFRNGPVGLPERHASRAADGQPQWLRGWTRRTARRTRIARCTEKEISYASLNRLSHQNQVKKIDGLSIRYAESEPRDVSAILLSPWPESLYTFEQMWSRLAGAPRRVSAAVRRAGTLVHRFSTVRAISFTARSPRPERGSGHG
jgi:hypothetical protein